MKKFAFFVLILCCLLPVFAGGCGERELPSANIVRDDARTGGTLSFVYDRDKRLILIGGEGEVVQFSSADEERGLAEGCRIGLKVTAPDEKLDLSNASLKMNGVTYSAGSFLESINEQPQRFFNIYPIVSPVDSAIKFEVTWQEGTKTQEYKIMVQPGTKFMDKDGKITPEN